MNQLTITTVNGGCISAIISPVLFIGDGAIGDIKVQIFRFFPRLLRPDVIEFQLIEKND